MIVNCTLKFPFCPLFVFFGRHAFCGAKVPAKKHSFLCLPRFPRFQSRHRRDRYGDKPLAPLQSGVGCLEKFSFVVSTAPLYHCKALSACGNKNLFLCFNRLFKRLVVKVNADNAVWSRAYRKRCLCVYHLL